jgi:hypothetical protein
MNTGLHRIELTGLTGLVKLAATSGGSSGQPEPAAARTFRSGFVWLPAALMIGFGAWMLLSEDASNSAESEPVQLATAVAPEPTLSPATSVAQDASLLNPATAPLAEIAPVDGLKISSQSWRRGGLGSKALVTFTLRNGNDYPVKDIEIFCSFARRDGSHLTDRKRMIHEIVNTRSRRTFARMHVGFVNVNADQAKCSLVTASRV